VGDTVGLPREVVELDVPGTVGLRFTNSWKALTWTTMTAVNVVDRGLALYRTRAGSPPAPWRSPVAGST
jgi:hypothetical protein